MKTYKKTDRKAFIKGVLDILDNKIIDKSSKIESTKEREEVWFHGSESVTFDTSFGPLEIRGITASSRMLTVFQAFRGGKEQYEKARKVLGDNVNPYTGKWNFHFTSNVDDALNLIKLLYLNVNLVMQSR